MRTAAVLLGTLSLFAIGCSGAGSSGVVGSGLDPVGYVNVLKDAGLPVGPFIVYDEASDPNEALGKPGKYVGKASWADGRSAQPCPDEEPGWECGGTVETFGSDGDRDSRFDYLSEISDDSILGGFYMWKTDNAVVRVGYALTPSAAATYDKALRDAVAYVVAFDLDSAPATSGELSSPCKAAVDAFINYFRELGDAIEADPRLVENPDFAGDVEAVGASLGSECSTRFSEAWGSVIDGLVEQLDTRSGASRVLLEAAIEAACGDFGPDINSVCTPDAASAVPAGTSGLTPSQEQAVRSAESYLDYTAFSRQGLIDQLSSASGDQFSVEDATVAVDSLNVNWNAQAVRSAREYLDFTSFSCQGLIDQLSSEYGGQFTNEQATFGARESGIC
jgi:hypothetical protein